MVEDIFDTPRRARRGCLLQVLETLAEVLFRRVVVQCCRAGLLAEFVTRLVHQNTHVGVRGCLEPEELLKPALAMRRFQQIGAPDHVSEMGLGVIDSCCQLVGVEAIASPYDKVFGRSPDVSRLLPHKPVAKSL